MNLGDLIRASVLGTGAGLTGARLGREDADRRRSAQAEEERRAADWALQQQLIQEQMNARRGAQKTAANAAQAEARAHQTSYDAARSRLGDSADRLGPYSPTTDYDDLARFYMEEQFRAEREAAANRSRERVAGIRAGGGGGGGGAGGVGGQSPISLSTLNTLVDDSRQDLAAAERQVPTERPWTLDPREDPDPALVRAWVADSTRRAGQRDDAQARHDRLTTVRDSVLSEGSGIQLRPLSGGDAEQVQGLANEEAQQEYREAAEEYRAAVAMGVPEESARQAYELILQAIAAKHGHMGRPQGEQSYLRPADPNMPRLPYLDWHVGTSGTAQSAQPRNRSPFIP